VLTTEFKVNLLSPAKGERFVAMGRVVRPGKKLMVCLGEVFAEHNGKRKQVALMTASMMVLDTSTGLKD
jgi:acyl-coenzyme A thioesterase PaaI-like protein